MKSKIILFLMLTFTVSIALFSISCAGSTEKLKFTLNEDGESYTVVGVTDNNILNISIPSKHAGLPVTAIGDGAFENCGAVKSVMIPNSIESIGAQAFARCVSLQTLKLSKSVKSIGVNAFDYNLNAKEVIYDGDIADWCNIQFEFYDSNPLYGSTDFESPTLYLNDQPITDLVIPDTVNKINDYAFYNYTKLNSVEISRSVTTIGKWAFAGCFDLNEIKVDADNENYQSLDGNLYSKDGTTLIQYSSGKLDFSFTVPDSVTTIEEFAISGAFNLTSLTISQNVTEVKNYAVAENIRLVEVINYSSAVEIDSDMLDNAIIISNGDTNYQSKITNDNGFIVLSNNEDKILVHYLGEDKSISLPSYVTKINEFAFSFLDSITSVVIGDVVTEIPDTAFVYCSSLTSIVIGDNVTSIGRGAFGYNIKLTSVVMGDSVETIGDSAFAYCYSLLSIEFGENVTRISDYAFTSCGSLTSVKISDSVTLIGESAFFSCVNLSTVIWGDGVETVGARAFGFCEKLTTVVFGKNLKDVDNSVFEMSHAKKKFYFKGNLSEWNESLDSFIDKSIVYFYVENEENVPTSGGNYWHYDENGNPVAW